LKKTLPDGRSLQSGRRGCRPNHHVVVLLHVADPGQDARMQATRRQRFRLSGGTEISFVTEGDPSRPALLLLHGFPNSSRMFGPLMEKLAGDAFAVAPDLPGFGESDPLPAATFSALGRAVSELLDHLTVGPRSVYLHDFGAPVGFQLAMRAPDKVLGLIVQNANAHRSGMGPSWAATQAYWANPTPANERAATTHLTLEGIRDQYVSGVPEDIAARVSPASWEEDWRVMQLPGRMETQRALLRDYGEYVKSFGDIGEYLRRREPPALLLWGRHDAFFDLAEVESWMRDLPRMESHVLDAGHLLLETHATEAAGLMRPFLQRA
jgi:pimeloyl-ACP methyl ester carboxylesterase